MTSQDIATLTIPNNGQISYAGKLYKHQSFVCSVATAIRHLNLVDNSKTVTFFGSFTCTFFDDDDMDTIAFKLMCGLNLIETKSKKSKRFFDVADSENKLVIKNLIHAFGINLVVFHGENLNEKFPVRYRIPYGKFDLDNKSNITVNILLIKDHYEFFHEIPKTLSPQNVISECEKLSINLRPFLQEIRSSLEELEQLEEKYSNLIQDCDNNLNNDFPKKCQITIAEINDNLNQLYDCVNELDDNINNDLVISLYVVDDVIDNYLHQNKPPNLGTVMRDQKVSKNRTPYARQ